MLKEIRMLLDLLFPGVCLACQKDIPLGANPSVCENCDLEIKTDPVPRLCVENIDLLFNGAVYNRPMRELIHSFKYRGKIYLADFFSQMCLEKWAMDSHRIDVIIPVPLPFWRRFFRGYNQSQLFGLKLARHLNKAVLDGVLRRKGGFSSQTRLSRNRRLENAEKSFYIAYSNSIKDKNILLVDDVMTTGATLRVCAGLLKKAGVRAVFAGTIAYEPINSNKNLP